MSDLISRDEAVKKLYQYAETKHTNGEIELANGILDAQCFLKYEENVPTDYDVDKVVAKLEDERELAYANFDDYADEVGIDKEYGDFFYEGLGRAIKIVKRGGKE